MKLIETHECDLYKTLVISPDKVFVKWAYNLTNQSLKSFTEKIILEINSASYEFTRGGKYIPYWHKTYNDIIAKLMCKLPMESRPKLHPLMTQDIEGLVDIDYQFDNHDELIEKWNHKYIILCGWIVEKIESRAYAELFITNRFSNRLWLGNDIYSILNTLHDSPFKD